MRIPKTLFIACLVTAFLAGALAFYAASPFIVSRTGISVPRESRVVLDRSQESGAGDAPRTVVVNGTTLTDSDLKITMDIPEGWSHRASWNDEHEAQLSMDGPAGDVYVAQVPGLGGACFDKNGEPAWKTMTISGSPMNYCDEGIDQLGRQTLSFEGKVVRGVPTWIIARVYDPVETNRQTLLSVLESIQFE